MHNCLGVLPECSPPVPVWCPRLVLAASGQHVEDPCWHNRHSPHWLSQGCHQQWHWQAGPRARAGARALGNVKLWGVHAMLEKPSHLGVEDYSPVFLPCVQPSVSLQNNAHLEVKRNLCWGGACWWLFVIRIRHSSCEQSTHSGSSLVLGTHGEQKWLCLLRVFQSRFAGPRRLAA